ncbi:hypothetical protein TNCV_1072221 [Trichonephila clavipes]|nr:hypothetical protein TNCV_1072221 [Trichonephila clavipes]
MLRNWAITTLQPIRLKKCGIDLKQHGMTCPCFPSMSRSTRCLSGVYCWLQCIKLPYRKSNLGNHTAQAKAVLVVITYQTGIGIRE